jgi:Zn-dependent protease with chaperone function
MLIAFAKGRGTSAMSAELNRGIKGWSLVLAMNILAHSAMIAAAVAMVAITWYFGVWFLLTGVLAWGVFALISPPTPDGLALRADDEPDLVALVQRLASQQGITSPLLLRMGPANDASLSTRRLRGRTVFVLELGRPMLAFMSVEELSAVILHEMAHIPHLSTPLDRALTGARNRLESAWQLPYFTNLLLRVTRRFTREREYAADAAAAAALGPEAVVSSLRRTAQIDELFDSLVDDWCDVLVEEGHFPQDLFIAAELAISDPEVISWIDANVSREIATDLEDDYPSMQARMDLLIPDGPHPRVEGAPVNIRNPDRLSEWSLSTVFDLTGEDNELTPGLVLDGAAGRFAPDPERAHAALRDATGDQRIHTALHETADLIESGGWRELADKLEPDIVDLPETQLEAARAGVLVSCVATALMVPLAAAGWGRANRWLAHILTSPDGERIDMFGLVDAAVHSSDTTALRALTDAAALGGVG